MNRWDTSYDVVVIGFGGAGATAARFAADKGAKVLLVDSAPKGYEGGNTRYSAQMISCSSNADSEKQYYKALTGPMDLDEDMIDTFTKGMVEIPEYLKKYLDVKAPFSIIKNVSALSKAINSPEKLIRENVQEYGEYPGAEDHDVVLVQPSMFDASLWKILEKKVLDRADQIDVWLNSPAEHLIQDKTTNKIIGVQIERDGNLLNVHANNGVVLATGGFENNKQMIQDYLGAFDLQPLGTTYNKGVGIKMAEEVGADMWHMKNYEALGILHGMAFKVPDSKRAHLILSWPGLSIGSIMVVGDDGSRYFREDEPNRHGHIYDHGHWRIPQSNVHPYLIFDQAKYDEFKQSNAIPEKSFFDLLVKADTLSELAERTQLNSEILQKSVEDFNKFAEIGEDYAFHRAPETMRAFADGPFYAAPLTNVVLNTQGGPRRNSHAEVLDANNKPIPHLYSAGELGGINANEYNAGENIAECLIFGKIAGENAATSIDSDHAEVTNTLPAINDLKPNKLNTSVGKNQYIGKSNSGIGDEIVVKVTMDDTNEHIKDIEIVQENESSDIGGIALKGLSNEMIKKNTYDVDAVSGASSSSNAIKEAVKNALSQIRK